MHKNDRYVLMILLLVLCSLILALGIYLLVEQVVTSQYVNRIGLEGRVMSIDTFCNNPPNQLNNSRIILALGSSNTISNINSTLMTVYLKDVAVRENLSLSEPYIVYNLAMAGSDPIIQSSFTDCYVKLRPVLVIVGVNQFSFKDDVNSDLIVILAHRFKTNTNYTHNLFFSENAREIMNYSWLENSFYKRKYVVKLLVVVPYEILMNLFTDNPNLLGVYTSNLEGTGGENIHYPFEKKHSLEEINYSINNDLKLQDISSFSLKNNLELQSFEYLVGTLNDNNISVFVVNYPLHPMLLKYRTSETALNYTNYMYNASVRLGFRYTDLRYLYSGVDYDFFFNDALHMSSDGQKNFTILLTDYLIHSKYLDLSEEI